MTAEGDREEAELDAAPEELARAELDKLAEAVYCLLREELILMRERRGETAGHWR